MWDTFDILDILYWFVGRDVVVETISLEPPSEFSISSIDDVN